MSYSYLVHFIYQDDTRCISGQGVAEMIQKVYEPITFKTLEDDALKIKKHFNYPDTMKINIVNWKRFEKGE